ncbi:MAG: 3-hydroxyacyl-CoA dehydrogenase family protein [Dehalococcoidales bacterium]|nr:3-hydroxyacyl-CoA dehydrogenase family protein [Dehalococcoidales bacterium]
MQCSEIGIIGLGTMGRGIAEVVLAAGYRVTALGRDDASCKSHIAEFSNSVHRLARLKRFPEDVANKLSDRLLPAGNLGELDRCSLVIESIPENLALKQNLFAELDRICNPDTVLATNTSCLTVSQIGSYSQDKTRIVGIHFFNPVSSMKLVEIVKTKHTSQKVFDRACEFCQSLGKTVVNAPDTPGFIVNRLLLSFLAEAMRLYELGVNADDIDKAVTLGLNHPMGPFKLADFIGLDTALSIARSMHEQLDSPHFAPTEMLESLVKEGKLGRKSGRGFYNY